MKKICRIWWPKHLSTAKTSSASSEVLFGWSFTSSLDSLDIVVAFALDEFNLAHSNYNLQEILRDVDGNMPLSLQDTATFSVVGHCMTDSSSNGQLYSCGLASLAANLDGSISYNGCQSCGCLAHDKMQYRFGQALINDNNWIQLVYSSHKQYGRKFCRTPNLHHIHWNGEIVSQCNFHIIVYESPFYGSHHFSLCIWDPSKQATCIKKPKWVKGLHQRQPLTDLDTIMLSINCSTAAKTHCGRYMPIRKSSACFFNYHMILAFLWQFMGLILASFSTGLYVILQFLHIISRYGSRSCIHMGLARMLSATSTNIQIRCSQNLYWPILLQDSGIRSKSCVEYKEKAALHKHALWSSLLVDVLLGNLIGFAMLYHAEFITMWIADFASTVTNMTLRSGCVWLMGNPAGFKLNTELAEVLGLMCLNAIQIWSALWNLLGSYLIYSVKGIAMSGILFGATILAALVMDIIALATLHISTLHWLISLLYSLQIQVLASIWRLFRGRKWNPLRLRLDSYDYNVEQHIVGSLLFTPLFLLLPTTSVFYIFFSMLHTTICLMRMVIEASISTVHATPYFKVVCWLVNRRRFPGGIWFEVLSCFDYGVDSQRSMSSDVIGSVSKSSKNIESSSRQKFTVVSVLHSNVKSLGQIVLPHYRSVFNSVPRSFFATLAYGILSGRGIPSTLGTGLPSAMPWMSIPHKEYWHLCRDAVVACGRH